MKEKEITLEDVMFFIIQNSENKEAMDKINKTTFPFTTKYEKFSETTQYIPYRKIDKSED